MSGTVSEVEYNLDDAKKTATLKDWRCHHISVTMEQFMELNIMRKSGNTDVEISFTGPPSDLMPGNEGLKITKTITEGS
jgi:hypothetical protein